MTRILLAVLVGLSAVAGSIQAKADMMMLTFNGTVNASQTNFDVYGTFGLGTSASLAGQNASLVFLFNANPGDTYLASVSPSPIYSMSLTINGRTFTTAQGEDGVPEFSTVGTTFLRNDIYSVLAANADITYPTASATTNRTGFYALIFQLLPSPFSPDLTTPFDVSGFLCSSCGTFIAQRSLPAGNDYFMGAIDISSATLTSIAEPATLPLLAAALAAILAMALPRRANAARSASDLGR